MDLLLGWIPHPNQLVPSVTCSCNPPVMFTIMGVPQDSDSNVANPNPSASEILIVKLNQNESDIEEMSAENKVKIIRQNITATGQKAIYDVNSDVINMYENVEVFENENYVKCDELFLDIKNSISIMKSASSKRVEAFLSSN